MLTTSRAGAHRQVAVIGSDTVGAVSDRLRTVDVVAAGTLSTVGAGLFVGLAPGASLAGAWLPAALVLAAVLAGLSTVEHQETREVLAGWRIRAAAVADGAGLLGRVAAGAALGGAVGVYVSPLVAPLFVMGVTAFTVTGFRLPVVVTRVAAVVVLGVLAVVAVACFAIAPEATPSGTTDPAGVIAAAGVLFVGFVGPEGPRRRALVVLGVVLVVSLAVAVAALRQLGAPRLALSPAPLRDVLAAADATPLTGLLTVGVVVACAFALAGSLGRVKTLLAARHAVPGTAVAGALAAGGAVLVDPVTTLVAAAALLLVEPVLRVVAGGPRRAK